MNSRFARIALVLVLAAGCANNVHASGLDDFPRGTVLPAATTLIGWQSAFDITKAANPTGVISSIKLERENGVWVYRSETGVGTFRQSVRTDINASTGQVRRVRRSNVGGGDQRNLQNIAVSQSTITVSFAQAASIAEARVPGLQAYNIRLERSGSRPLSYKVELFVNGAAAEVRVNAATGAIVGVQTVGTPRPVGTTPPATGGTTPPAGGGTPPAGGGTTPPVALTGNALLLSNAISNALATEPAGTLILEAKFKVNRFQNVVEVKTVEAGSLAAEEISLTPSTGAIVRRENEGLDAGDAATAAALFNALAGQTAIGHASAISRALAARSGDVSEIEMQMQGAIAIYEVKIVQAGRERSVKVNAITGAIVR
ncbi:hypothetical protein LBMAG48_23750 [Phycisphaerae bacterium]|nr:hypothetical protein LBMAG48_23750 [Phycisphaerae bacterium]